MIENNYLNKIFKFSPVPSLLLFPDAPNFSIADVNTAFVKVISIRKSNLAGKGIAEAFPYQPEDLTSGFIFNLRQSLLTVISTGKPHKMPAFRYESPADGGNKFVIKYFVPENIPLIDDEGNVAVIMLTLTDITDFKKLEIKQKEIDSQQYFFESIVKNSDDAIISKTMEGIIKSWNRGAETMLGYTEKEAIGRRISMIVPKALFIEERNIVQRIKKGDHIDHYETKRLRKDGSLVSVSLSVSPVLDADGNIIGFTKIARDITARKKAEDQLKESEQKYRLMVERNLAGIYQTTPDGTILACNDAFARKLGYPSHKDLLLKNAGILYFSNEERNAFIARLRKTGKLKSPEMMLKHRNGSPVYFVENCSISKNLESGEEIIDGVMIDITGRRKAEQQLRSQYGLLIALINSTKNIIIFSLDKNYCYTAFNDCHIAEMKKVWNQDIKIGKNLLEYMNLPEVSALAKRSIDRTLQGESFSEIQQQPGVDICYEFTWNPIFQNEEVTGVTVFIQDISERRKVEAALQKSKAILRNVLDNAPIGIWMLNSDGHMLFVNKAYCDAIGISEGRFLTVPHYAILYPPEIAAACIASDQRAIAGKGPYISNERLLFTDGKVHDVEILKIRISDEQGGNAGLIGLMQDVTERKLSEEKILQLSQAVEQSPVSIVITDTTGAIQYVNQKFVDITGYGYEEAIGKNPNILKSGHTSPEEYKQLWDTIVSGAEWHGEFQDKKKDGSLYWESAAISPIINAEGIITHFLAIKEDITGRKKSEEKLKDTITELEQFAYVASHDLQEPLRMVTSFLTQLEKKYGDVVDEKGKKYIDFAVDGAQRMRQIIQDLLEFSRVGRTDDKLEAVDLNELIKEIQVLFRKQVEEKDAHIHADTLPVINDYKTPLRQVFQNLIGNALKYGKKDVPVKIDITVKELKNYWQFAVADNGIGIDKEYFDKIFVIFQRLHNKDVYSGTGIGLALTKKIINKQGGKIWLESEPGKGTTFYFTIKKL